MAAASAHQQQQLDTLTAAATMMIDAHQIDCAKRVTAASEDPPPIVVTAPEKLRGFCARPEPAPGLWYRVPELSPTLGDELSPNGPQVDTPVGAAALVRPMGEKRIDPVQELRKRELPDLMAHDMPDSILQKVWALVGGLEPDDDDDGSRPGSLSPNMDLLDPRNAAVNQMSYTAVGSDLGWLSGDVEANVREASLLRTEPRLDPAVREPSLLRTEPRSSPAVPAALASVGQRYGLRETPAALLGMLQAAFVDSTTTMRVRQFWAALEGGGAGDFEVLAHLTIAAREAQVGSRNELAATESLCFDAARSEWDRGRVVASPGVVFGLLLLSEYGFQTGRSAVLWEFAQNALSTARKLVFRRHPFPWHGARTTPCDVAYEYVLSCYWNAWARVLTAAQTMTRRVGPELLASLPEFPLHDVCHYGARPRAGAVGSVLFDAVQCEHRPHHSYSAFTWRCTLMAAEIHNTYIDLLDRRCTPAAYLAALRAWDHNMRRWRAAWPLEWARQADTLLGGEPQAKPPAMSTADSWLCVLLVMYHASRLRMHRIGLALLNAGSGSSSGQHVSLVSVGPPYDTQMQALDIPPSSDPLLDAVELHRCQFICLDTARDLQSLFATMHRRGSSVDKLGIWGLSVLENIISVQCKRVSETSGGAQLDALRRLSGLVSQLLGMKRWTSALYVFTCIVKGFVHPTSTMPVHANVPKSPWPSNHILTLLMDQMGMSPMQFCAYTVPIVYASIMSSPSLPRSMRMRIASLIS